MNGEVFANSGIVFIPARLRVMALFGPIPFIFVKSVGPRESGAMSSVLLVTLTSCQLRRRGFL